MKKRPLPRIDDQLRAAIEDCGLTRYELWKKTGVSQASLSRFMSGQRDLQLARAADLCRLLGLSLSKE